MAWTCTTVGSAGSLNVSGFQLTNSWTVTPGQINIWYYLSPIAATGTYSLKLVTPGGSSTSTFTVVPYTEVTVIAWICGSCITLPILDDQLTTDLNYGPSCVVDALAWMAGIQEDINGSADVTYANAFLLQNSANSPPPSNIGPAPSAYEAGGNYRLFIDYGNPAVGNVYAVGATPQPCHGYLSPNFSAGGQDSPYNGSTGTSATGLPYLLVEGRVGSSGQLINQTLNGTTAPWIWSVIEFTASGTPVYSNHAVFPWYTA